MSLIVDINPVPWEILEQVKARLLKNRAKKQKRQPEKSGELRRVMRVDNGILAKQRWEEPSFIGGEDYAPFITVVTGGELGTKVITGVTGYEFDSGQPFDVNDLYVVTGYIYSQIGSFTVKLNDVPIGQLETPVVDTFTAFLFTWSRDAVTTEQIQSSIQNYYNVYGDGSIRERLAYELDGSTVVLTRPVNYSWQESTLSREQLYYQGSPVPNYYFDRATPDALANVAYPINLNWQVIVVNSAIFPEPEPGDNVRLDLVPNSPLPVGNRVDLYENIRIFADFGAFNTTQVHPTLPRQVFSSRKSSTVVSRTQSFTVNLPATPEEYTEFTRLSVL